MIIIGRYYIPNRPFLTQKECELLEMGFKLDKEIPKDHVPLPKEYVDKIIAKFE